MSSGFYQPELIFLENKVNLNGGKSILLLDSLINPNFWIESKKIKINNENMLKKISKVNNFNEFYLKAVNKVFYIARSTKKRIVLFLNDILSYKILPLVFNLSTISKSKFTNYGLSNGGSHAVVVQDLEEKNAINKIQPHLDVHVAQPPFLLKSKSNNNNNLLVLVHGPFSKYQLEHYTF